MSIAAGSRLGPYEILAAIGAGGMGEVYKAWDTRLERAVAIKVLPQRLSSSPEVRQRFEREAKTISQLSHPHICALYDVGREGETEYLVMEYLEGETLAVDGIPRAAGFPLFGGGAPGGGDRSGDLSRREVGPDLPAPDHTRHTRAPADRSRAAKDLPEGLDRPVRTTFGAFLPDGKRIAFNGHETGKPSRVFVQDLVGGAARPVTPEGVTASLVSADGKFLLARTAGKAFGLAPLDGGGLSEPIRGLEPTDEPLRWAADGRSLFLGSSKDFFPARVYRLDLATGRQEVWKEFMPGDPTGITNIGPSSISADGKIILFGYGHILSDLYVADGLR